MTCALGNIPKRFEFKGGMVDIETYFKVARGNTGDSNNNQFASEMTKWFDTNYHYIVPEFDETTQFKLSTNKIFDEYTEAKQLGIETRPVLIGPVTYLKIGKVISSNMNKYDLLDSLLSVYEEIFKKCESLGVINIQVDEPIAALDLTSEEKNALKSAYDRLSKATKINIHLATYFGDLRDNQPIIYGLPVQSIHLDQTRQGIDESIMAFPEDKVLSLGIVNGRNIWINDFDASIKTIKLATSIVGHERLIVASSCSLLHSPVTIQSETTLNQEIKQWLSFADEKVLEIKALSDLAMGDNSELLTQNQNAIANRRSSSLIHNESVKNRVAQIKSSDFNRKSHFEERQKGQQIKFDFPLFPTTTIGSFPQTTDVREARSKHKKESYLIKTMISF